jgi:hypothetical protein
MPLFGTDTSSYQPFGTYDPGGYEIINVLDPTLPDKVTRNRNDRRPWGVYSWVFPGEHGSYPVGRALNALAKVGGGNPPLGTWWDFEDGQDSGEQWQLEQAFRTADANGIWSGYYSNDWRVDHPALYQAVGWRPYWMAAYPAPNDGNWRNYTAVSARDIQIWQWSSTDGRLDLNAVWDEPWYNSVIGGSGPSPQPPKKKIREGDSVLYITGNIIEEGRPDAGKVLTVMYDTVSGAECARLTEDPGAYGFGPTASSWIEQGAVAWFTSPVAAYFVGQNMQALRGSKV